MEIVLATKNRGKLREIKGILKGLSIEILTLEDFPGLDLPPENADTFEENALVKARYVAQGTGLPALADDSGLEVDALAGAPGVRSARYAGPGASDKDNMEKLLEELKGIPAEKRSARFICVAAYAEPDGVEKTFQGRFEGMIAESATGEGGFGYDPVFFIPELGRTAAELTSEEKNELSHRGQALAGFKAWFLQRTSGVV
jgi:XTP/dITP diphosphohydrolase